MNLTQRSYFSVASVVAEYRKMKRNKLAYNDAV